MLLWFVCCFEGGTIDKWKRFVALAVAVETAGIFGAVGRVAVRFLREGQLCLNTESRRRAAIMSAGNLAFVRSVGLDGLGGVVERRAIGHNCAGGRTPDRWFPD